MYLCSHSVKWNVFLYLLMISRLYPVLFCFDFWQEVSLQSGKARLILQLFQTCFSYLRSQNVERIHVLCFCFSHGERISKITSCKAGNVFTLRRSYSSSVAKNAGNYARYQFLAPIVTNYQKSFPNKMVLQKFQNYPQTLSLLKSKKNL